MAEIKPAEISAILKQQLADFQSGATLEEVGTVLQVGRRYCSRLWIVKCSIWRIGTI